MSGWRDIMDTKTTFFRLTVFFLFCGLTVAYSQEKSHEPEDRSSLIRMDLLQKERKSLAPPQRNIFTPQRLRPGMDRPGEAGSLVDPSGSKDAAGAESPEQEMTQRIDIQYIGYIGSRERTVAIIIFNGEALAVEKGEPISEQIIIREITPQSIEFEGPDSIPNKVFLEGEE